MTQMILQLSEEAAEAWEERAKREGFANAAEAAAAQLEYEVEPIDPAEVELLRERIATDPSTDLTIDQVAAHFEKKYGVKIRRPDDLS